MDSEKYLEIQKKINTGASPNDEGPYYHHSWWESYKGGIKGKLGGVVVGAMIGTLIGGVVAAGMALIPTVAFGFGAAATLIGGFAAAGSLYAAHEFSDIGKVTGAVAASQEQAEARMKTFEDGRFSELKQEIAELKALVKGTVPPEKTAISTDDDKYRTTHYAKVKTPLKNRLVFWKVAAIGLAIGLGAGALFAYGGIAEHLLNGLVDTGGPLSQVGLYTASMTVMGALGASFGINRDIFRRIFDKTDLWTKGFLGHNKIREHQITAGQLFDRENGKQKETEVATVEYSGIDYPASSTYHRDKVLAAAEKALLNFDHTRATPQ